MKPAEINKLVGRLGALPFFPADDDARIAIAEIFASMARNTEEVRWTVNRCLQIWDKWEGPHELRSVLCGKFIPADGVNAYSRLPQFADGIPSENEDRNLELTGATEPKRLPPGAAVALLEEVALTEIPAKAKPPAVAGDEIEKLKHEQAKRARGEDAVRELEETLGIAAGRF